MLINPLVALLLILLEHRRLPDFGLRGQGKSKAEEGSRKGKISGEAGARRAALDLVVGGDSPPSSWGQVPGIS